MTDCGTFSFIRSSGLATGRFSYLKTVASYYINMRLAYYIHSTNRVLDRIPIKFGVKLERCVRYNFIQKCAFLNTERSPHVYGVKMHR